MEVVVASVAVVDLVDTVLTAFVVFDAMVTVVVGEIMVAVVTVRRLLGSVVEVAVTRESR